MRTLLLASTILMATAAPAFAQTPQSQAPQAATAATAEAGVLTPERVFANPSLSGRGEALKSSAPKLIAGRISGQKK